MGKTLRWFRFGLLGVLAVALLALVVALIVGTTFYIRGGQMLNRTFDVQPAPISIPTDAASIEHGQYLAFGVAVCANCHGENMAGQVMVDDPMLGFVRTANLTSGRGGIGATYTDEDWVRAIRHGVRPDGKGLAFMASDYFYFLNDEDLGALIAYLKSVPPVDTEPGELSFGPIPQMAIGAGQSGEIVRAALMDHDGPRPPTPATHGEYLAVTTGCTFCHGPNFAGGQGPEPGAPPGPSLLSNGVMRIYSEQDFINTMRTGVTPYGHEIDPLFMPWQGYRHMNDNDLIAIYEFLMSLPIEERVANDE